MNCKALIGPFLSCFQVLENIYEMALQEVVKKVIGRIKTSTFWGGSKSLQSLSLISLSSDPTSAFLFLRLTFGEEGRERERGPEISRKSALLI